MSMFFFFYFFWGERGYAVMFSKFSRGGHVLETLFPKPSDGGGGGDNAPSLSLHCFLVQVIRGDNAPSVSLHCFLFALCNLPCTLYACSPIGH